MTADKRRIHRGCGWIEWRVRADEKPLNCARTVVARAGIEPATFRFSGGRSYRLSYLAGRHRVPRRGGDPDGTRTRDLRRDRAAR